MIIEHALLNVVPGKVSDFERALQQAMVLISASPGFQGLEIRRNAAVSHQYLLLVRWDSIADHRDGFRKSERYQQWKDLLHGFYDPFPVVSYFDQVVVQA
ncbi:MAG: antibiotic biosynthesis monooxygenase [Aestuariivirga sp.]